MASSSTSQPAGSLLIGSTLGLLGGLFLVVCGRAIMEAVQSGTYETVLGIEVLNSLVVWIGVFVCVFAFLGIMVGVAKSIR